MKRATKALILAVGVLALAGCSNAQNEAESAAVAFVKASSAEACSMYSGRTEIQIKDCETAAESQNVKATPYADGDYTTTPHVTESQERGEGYAFLVEATKNDGTTTQEVIGVVPEGESWKVDESHEVEDSGNSDLCYYIGGDCK